MTGILFFELIRVSVGKQVVSTHFRAEKSEL